ncbi:MAG TPA: hypothetical protein PKM51_01700 [Chitinophagales bacterium]|nr:hypothetical protein [Chitinophagales bacterium]
MFNYLALTIFIEIPIYFLFVRKQFAYSILILVLANCLTWPILNILYHTTSIPLLVLESGVTLVEAIIIYYFLQQRFLKALLISFVQNAVTTFLGVWINHIKI